MSSRRSLGIKYICPKYPNDEIGAIYNATPEKPAQLIKTEWEEGYRLRIPKCLQCEAVNIITINAATGDLLQKLIKMGECSINLSYVEAPVYESGNSSSPQFTDDDSMQFHELLNPDDPFTIGDITCLDGIATVIKDLYFKPESQ